MPLDFANDKIVRRQETERIKLFQSHPAGFLMFGESHFSICYTTDVASHHKVEFRIIVLDIREMANYRYGKMQFLFQLP